MASKAIGFLNFKFGADLSGFERAMNKTQKSLKKFGKNIEKTGQNLSRNLTLPILGLGAAALKFGSDLQETDSKFNQVFSSIQKEAQETAKIFKDSFGLSELAAKQLLSDTGDLLVGFGFTEKAALDLASQVNELAVDLASFTNFEGGAEGASKALTKALVGETESSKALGIVIRQGTREYKDRTLAIMQEQGVSILQAKAINNLEIAYSQSQKAIGDFSRTSGDFANQMRILQGDLVDVAAEMGARLIPYAQAAIEKFKLLIQWFDGLSESTKDNIVKWGLVVAAIGPALIIIGKLSLGLSALVPVVGGVIRVLGFLRLAILTNPIGILVSALALAAGAFMVYKDTANDASQATDEFDGSVETLAEKMERLNKLANDSGKGQFDLGIEEMDKELLNLQKRLDAMQDIRKAKPGKMRMLRVDELGLMKDIEEVENLLIRLKIAQKESNNVSINAVEINGKLSESIGKYSQALDPLITSIKEFADISTKMWEDGGILEGPKNMLNWTEKLTKAQEAHNATMELMEDIMFSAAMSAANSQEKFFKSFIENIKKAVEQLLIQLAVMTVINLILGGPSMTIAKAFSSSKASVLGLAEGGLVTGPTTALIGEGVGTTASNPEVVAPLDKLKQYMGGGSQNVVVTGKIVGNDIWLSNEKTQFNRQRTT